MCIVESSSCNTCKALFYGYVTLFSYIVSFVQEHLACLWLWNSCTASKPIIKK